MHIMSSWECLLHEIDDVAQPKITPPENLTQKALYKSAPKLNVIITH